MKILVIDIGGTHIKVLATGRKTALKIDSGPEMTPAKMAADVKAAVAGWNYDAITFGYPGPIVDHRPSKEPAHLGPGWVEFDFKKAFRKPIKMINDAAMQALGSYEGGRMLFLGLGTGLGSALIVNNSVAPLELAHLPYKQGKSFEEYSGVAALERLGKKRWRREVEAIVRILKAAMQADYVLLGGGNAKFLKKLPEGARLGDNANAFRGGFRLWTKQFGG